MRFGLCTIITVVLSLSSNLQAHTSAAPSPFPASTQLVELDQTGAILKSNVRYTLSFYEGPDSQYPSSLGMETDVGQTVCNENGVCLSSAASGVGFSDMVRIQSGCGSTQYFVFDSSSQGRSLVRHRS